MYNYIPKSNIFDTRMFNSFNKLNRIIDTYNILPTLVDKNELHRLRDESLKGIKQQETYNRVLNVIPNNKYYF